MNLNGNCVCTEMITFLTYIQGVPVRISARDELPREFNTGACTLFRTRNTVENWKLIVRQSHAYGCIICN